MGNDSVASFLVGGLAGGRIGMRAPTNRARHLVLATTTQLLLVACALVVAALASRDPGTGSRYALIVLLAVAMGIQNTAARTLAVPDLTTTVLTMTPTGVAADARLAGGHGLRLGRRALSIAAMLLGALLGGLLVLRVDTPSTPRSRGRAAHRDLSPEFPRLPRAGRVGTFRDASVIA